MALMTLIDSDRQWCKSALGIEPGELPRDLAFCDRTIRSRDALVIDDTLADPRFARHPMVVGPPGIRAYLGAPLCTPEGYNVGALCVIDTRPASFSEEQVAILHGFAGLAVEQMELRLIASRDSLTGALSRRAFEEHLGSALARHLGEGEPSRLALVDIDHFKTVNDSHGHAAGDAVLAAVSARLQAGLRRGDALGRMGGEEFGVLLRDCGHEEALAIAERLRLAVADIALPALPGVQVTASFGLAPCAAETGSVAGWLAAADASLYRAKRNGRNRCEF